MLTYRYVPLAKLARMKHDHASVMAALYSFADGDGVCWPSLRTLANTCEMTLSKVQRAINQMAALGYIAISRARSFTYRISVELLPTKPAAKVESPTSETQSSTGGTEGESKERKISEESLKKGRGGFLRRCAPLSDSKPPSPPGNAADDISDDPPPPPRDQVAYAAGTAAAKRQNMLLTIRGLPFALPQFRGEVGRQVIELVDRLSVIAGDSTAWKAWKQANPLEHEELERLKKLADLQRRHGTPVPARAAGCYLSPEDPHDAREALATIAAEMRSKDIEEWNRAREASRQARLAA